MTTLTILGAGVMGSAMTLPAADRGMSVRLAGTHLDEAIVDSVKAGGRHPKLNVKLPEAIVAYRHHEIAAAIVGCDLVLLGVSSAGIGWAIDRLCETLTAPVPVLMITKGMKPEAASLKALPDHVADELKTRTGLTLPIAAIGGPCIAGELAVRRHTGTVIVAHDEALARRLCALFETAYYHPRPSTDVIGVEVCAAFKNFFAIAVGWAAGHIEMMPATDNKAFNHNAAAILFDQAIVELLHIATALGGKPESVWGMPGAGDLYVTCQAGRNSRLGNHLGRGLSYRQTKAGPMKGDTIEGAELGLAAAASLRAMMQAGTLARPRLPLTGALLAALVEDTPLDIPWTEFQR